MAGEGALLNGTAQRTQWKMNVFWLAILHVGYELFDIYRACDPGLIVKLAL
jgi:hypothetical protein